MSVAAVAVPLLMVLAGAQGAAVPTPGTVDVALVDPRVGDQAYADAVRQALSDLAFTPMPTPDHGRYIADVSVTRQPRGVVLSRVPNERAMPYVGGVVVPLGTHKLRLQDLTMVTLTIRLIARADHHVVWSGSAVTADVNASDTAARLSHAALSSFPTTLTVTASVP